MALLLIFLLGCFITSIVAVGMLFALASVGYGDELQSAEPKIEQEAMDSPQPLLYPESDSSVSDH